MAKRFGALNGEMVIDLRDINRWMERTGSMLAEMEKPAFRNAVNDVMVRIGQDSFGVYADRAARQNPRELHHVYEWTRVGRMNGRLFRLDTVGRNPNKTMFYTFLQSRKFVPIAQEARAAGVQSRPFYWKAPIMEEGQEVTISPERARYLAWWSKQHGEMRFSWVEQSPDISRKTKGQFENIWRMFWAGVFEPTVLQPAANELEREMGQELEMLGRVSIGGTSVTASRARAQGGFGFRVLTGGTGRGVAEGRAAANKVINRLRTVGEKV